MTLFISLNRLNRNYLSALTSILQKVDLTPGNWSLLQYLHINQTATSSQLAEYWEVEKPTVSANVKTLLKRNYITVTSGQDKREKQLMLTTSGEDVFSAISEEVFAFQAKLLGNLTPEMQETFVKAIQEMELELRGLRNE